jgi:superfamily II DNA or RNA helicase
MDSYIGSYGYTIHKKYISSEQVKKITSDLTVKPNIHNGMPSQSVTSFPVYRESSSKYYVPKFYGIEHFGSVQTRLKENSLANDLLFVGSLREYQNTIVDKYINIAHNGQDIGGGGLLEIDTGLGKTVIAINIIAKLKVKTLIVVHKEFLLNQWIERLNEFTPAAKIGRIQGKIMDTEGKDVVIAMLQSISMKDYNPDIFKQFGLMVIDEVHHMGAEVFSNALSKVVTKYTLGLSATMNRKDGLAKVFKMFLGPIIHTEKRELSMNQVNVRCLQYFTRDEEFNETSYDYRGKTQYSKMISKLCSYNHRSEYILRYICELLREDPKQQIMILAHNKCLLKYFYDSIVSRNIANQSVGYYVGGMKESDLKISEKKTIVIATYSMASEGLDIKTLTTLVLATPKTDVVQAVGRILRVKHANPLVIDVIDSHEIFKRQFSQRKRFYKSQEYGISFISSNLGSFDKKHWQTKMYKDVDSKQRDKNTVNCERKTSATYNAPPELLKILNTPVNMYDDDDDALNSYLNTDEECHIEV